MSDKITVADNPDRSRYELTVEGAVAGFANYRLGDRVIVFIHTEIDQAYEGRGLGTRLVRAALDDVRHRGLRVRPQCPFFASFIASHPDYADLVAQRVQKP